MKRIRLLFLLVLLLLVLAACGQTAEAPAAPSAPAAEAQPKATEAPAPTKAPVPEPTAEPAPAPEPTEAPAPEEPEDDEDDLPPEGGTLLFEENGLKVWASDLRLDSTGDIMVNITAKNSTDQPKYFTVSRDRSVIVNGTELPPFGALFTLEAGQKLSTYLALEGSASALGGIGIEDVHEIQLPFELCQLEKGIYMRTKVLDYCTYTLGQ